MAKNGIPQDEMFPDDRSSDSEESFVFYYDL